MPTTAVVPAPGPTGPSIRVRGDVATVQQGVIELAQPVSGYSRILVVASTEIVVSEGQPGSLADVEPGSLVSVTGYGSAPGTLTAQRIVVLGA